MPNAIHHNLIEVTLFVEGEPTVQVPRVMFEDRVGKTGMSSQRHQFPLRVAIGMTVNKSQRQTLATVGLDLRDDPFAHGQLYVALSRARGRQCIRCLVPPERVIQTF